jgi:hypothetical protein
LNGTGPQTFTGNNKFTGTFLAQNASNSTTAFQIQNAAGTSNLLVADTTNTRLAVGQASASYTLDVAGDVNLTTGSVYRINGVQICSSGGCLVGGGSGSYIQNGTSTQASANFNIQSAAAGSVGGIIQGAASQTADLFDLKTSTPATVLSVSASGATIFKNSADSTTAFQVQNSAGTSNLLVADTTNTRIGIGTAPAYTLDVAGDINSTGSYRINGTPVCTAAGCTPATDNMQAGVVNGGDGVLSSVSVNGGTGAITFTPSGGTAYVGSPIERAAIASSVQTITPGTLPTSGNFMAEAIALSVPSVWGNTAGFATSSGSSQTSQANALANPSALSSTQTRLVDVIIWNNAGTYTLSTTRDRRPWARGFYNRVGGVGGTFNNASFVAVGGTTSMRVECTGRPLEITVMINAYTSANTNNQNYGYLIDGATGNYANTSFPGAGYEYTWSYTFVTTPSAGSHLFAVGGQANGSPTWNFFDEGAAMVITEKPQSTNNGTN